MNAQKTVPAPAPLLSNERRFDLLVSAIEGGSNYWYEFSHPACDLIDAHDPAAYEDTFVERLFCAVKAGLVIPVHDREEGKPLGSLSMGSIAVGEHLMLAHYPHHFADIIAERDDAITADVWFQYAVMNALVYG